ncbi:MAG: hypothetical protein IKA62_05675 [Clostridia bacterium]|nr:hypothetical protein [Clostridia bacterium]
MKRKIVASICILFVLITLIVVPSCSGNPSGAPSVKDIISKRIPKIGLAFGVNRCGRLFGCTPEEFLDGNFDAVDDIGYLCQTAKIDSDGSLVLYFTEEQLTKFKKSDFLTNFDEYENIKVSSDLTEITLYGYEETILDDFLSFTVIFDKLVLFQQLNMISLDDINVSYQIKDAVRHDLVYSESWYNGWYNDGDYDAGKGYTATVSAILRYPFSTMEE